MIRFFIYALLALGIGTFLSIKLAEDPGYVLISFHGWSIEATLVSMLLFIVLVFVVVSGLWWLLKRINPLQLLKKETWRSVFSRGSPEQASEKGLQLLMLGHWQEAYKLLLENAEKTESPIFNYLAASLAAYQRNDNLAWNYCLDQAEKKNKVSAPGIKSLKALLELKKGRVEQSLAILLTLNKEVPGSPYVLTLLKDIYLSVSDWGKIAGLVPELEKYKVLDSKSIQQLHEGIILHQLEQAANSVKAKENLKQVWNDASKILKSSENVTASYLRKLLLLGQDAEATVLLTRYLKQNWSDTLVEMLGYIDGKDSGQQLLLLEGWVKSRPNNVTLMLTLGRVSLRNQLWGKGREYFESALRLSTNKKVKAEINAELGRLFEHLGEDEKSMECYNQAMNLLEKKLPDLPMPIKAS